MPGVWDDGYFQVRGRGVVLGFEGLHCVGVSAVVDGDSGAEEVVAFTHQGQDGHGDLVGGLLGRRTADDCCGAAEFGGGGGVFIGFVGGDHGGVGGGRVVEQG